MEMKETKLHPCYCGGEMRIRKVSQHCGMDGTYWNWELSCSKCGLTKTYAADGFYGRDYKTFEEVVEDWNKKSCYTCRFCKIHSYGGIYCAFREKGGQCIGYDKWESQEDVLDKIKAEIREWYWQADKQTLAKDPCVVDAMIDLFIRTIYKYKNKVESEEGAKNE